MRLFTAVEIGDPAQRDVGALVDELRRRAGRLAPAARVTWVVQDRAHLTLRFIGEVDDTRGAGVIASLRDPIAADPFVVRWGAPGAFPARGAPRVLWIGVDHGADRLIMLEAAVSMRLKTLGMPHEKRPYRPHLTLGRVREPSGLRVPQLFSGLDSSIADTRVDAITLFQSTLSPKGSTYTVLQKTAVRR